MKRNRRGRRPRLQTQTESSVVGRDRCEGGALNKSALFKKNETYEEKGAPGTNEAISSRGLGREEEADVSKGGLGETGEHSK